MIKTLKEFIAEKLIKTEVFEMAQSLQTYKSTIDRLLPMLVCHIMLIMIACEEDSEEYDLENKDTYKYILDVFHKFQETYLDELIDVLANKSL